MNKLSGTIKKIKSVDGITQIAVDVDEKIFNVLVLDGDEEYRESQKVHLLFKESEVLIASKSSKVSARNAFVSKITHIENGEILSQVEFDFCAQRIVSIITKDALSALECKMGDEFMWLVKSNEVSLQSF